MNKFIYYFATIMSAILFTASFIMFFILNIPFFTCAFIMTIGIIFWNKTELMDKDNFIKLLFKELYDKKYKDSENN